MAIVLPLSQAQWICETSSFYCTIPCAAPHFGNRLRRKPVCADHGITAAATNQHTQKQQDKSGSDSAKTTVADPTQGNWTETYSSPTDLDGELDKAWLKCAPQNNPDPEAFAWKRSTDHSKVWLHATKGQMDGATQRSCMADELDIPDATELTTSWTKTALGDYDRIQRQSNNSIDIVWQYSNAVTASLSAQTDSYRVTLPYSWHNEVSISVDGNTITVTDKEHPNYSLCTFKVSSDTNAGDIGNSLIERYQIGDTPVQLWATRWAFVAVTDPSSISAEDAEDITELQTGDTIDYESLISQVQSGDYSGLFTIDEFLKAHITVSSLS